MTRIDWNRSPHEIFNRIFDDAAKTYIHTRFHAYCAEFVPMDSNALNTVVDITPDYVHYRTPYAHFQWNGKVFVDARGSPYARRGTSKHATNRDLHYSPDKNPRATSHWNKAMMAAKGEDFLADIEAYLRHRKGS